MNTCYNVVRYMDTSLAAYRLVSAACNLRTARHYLKSWFCFLSQTCTWCLEIAFVWEVGTFVFCVCPPSGYQT